MQAKSTILVIPELVCLNFSVNALLGLVLPSRLHLALQFLEHKIFHCIGLPVLTRATWGLQQRLPVAMGYCSPEELSQPKENQLTPSSPGSQALGLWPPQHPQSWGTGPCREPPHQVGWCFPSSREDSHILSLDVSFNIDLSESIFHFRRFVFFRHSVMDFFFLQSRSMYPSILTSEFTIWF